MSFRLSSLVSKLKQANFELTEIPGGGKGGAAALGGTTGAPNPVCGNAAGSCSGGGMSVEKAGPMGWLQTKPGEGWAPTIPLFVAVVARGAVDEVTPDVPRDAAEEAEVDKAMLLIGWTLLLWAFDCGFTADDTDVAVSKKVIIQIRPILTLLIIELGQIVDLTE